MQYFTAEKNLEHIDEDLEEDIEDDLAVAPDDAAPVMNVHTRFPPDDSTSLVSDEGDALVNVVNRKCYLHNFFYIFYNRIIL